MRKLGHAGVGPADGVSTSIGDGTPGPALESVVSAVQERPLSALSPWPGNPRTIAPERLEQLKQALAADREMLQARPLLALPDGTVIAGNQRLRAARELGWATIPVVTVDLEPERAQLWALRDNSPYGDWDEPALAELLAELAEGGVELALSGFAGGEIDRLLAGLQSPSDPDDAPPLPEREPDSQLGRIYQLGPHRLACGDAATASSSVGSSRTSGPRCSGPIRPTASPTSAERRGR
jgi:ParB-like nuclease domain